MDGSDHRDEIVRLEEQIDEFAVKIESSRKFILVGKIVVAWQFGLALSGGEKCVGIHAGAMPSSPSLNAPM